MKVSIIIPIYNSEAFLEKCLDSLLKQKFRDFEALLINDGSTDNSIVICEKYAMKDQRFKVYTQLNEGVSVARNNGIKHAAGDWLIFLDSDDSLQEDSLSLIFGEVLGDEDFLVARAYLYNEKSIVEERYPFKRTFLEQVFTGEELALEYRYKHGSAYGCLFNRQFLYANNITFPVNIKNGEDSIFTTLCHLYAKKVRFLDIHLYNVNEREGSASRSWDIDRILHMNKNFEFLNNFLNINLNLTNDQRIIVNYNLLGVVSKMLHGVFSCFSFNNYILVRKIIKEGKPKRIFIGRYKKYKWRVALLNTSIDLYAVSLLVSKVIKKIKK